MLWPTLFPCEVTDAMRDAAAHSSRYVQTPATPWREEIGGRPVARVSDPTTSHQAAVDASRGAATLRARCLSALREAGDLGLTDFALADLVGSQQTSAGKRRGELVRAGLVVNSGRTRPAPSGSQAIVWRAV